MHSKSPAEQRRLGRHLVAGLGGPHFQAILTRCIQAAVSASLPMPLSSIIASLPLCHGVPLSAATNRIHQARCQAAPVAIESRFFPNATTVSHMSSRKAPPQQTVLRRWLPAASCYLRDPLPQLRGLGGGALACKVVGTERRA